MADEYECNQCGATFDTEEELQEHNRKEHGESRQADEPMSEE